MECWHCGAPQTWDHICAIACLDWMRNLETPPWNFAEVTRCYDDALALQMGERVPGLRQTRRAAFI